MITIDDVRISGGNGTEGFQTRFLDEFKMRQTAVGVDEFESLRARAGIDAGEATTGPSRVCQKFAGEFAMLGADLDDLFAPTVSKAEKISSLKVASV